MFLGMGFGGYALSVIIAWFIQRHILTKVPVQVAETFVWVLWIPMANIIISLIFLFASNNQVTSEWIKKNIYQIHN